MARSRPDVPAVPTPGAEPPSPRSIRQELERVRTRIAAFLPSGEDPERVITSIVTLVSGSKDLLKCTRDSIIRGVLEGTELGLTFARSLGEAYLVPFRDKKEGGIHKAAFIPGYRGLIKLALQSEQVDWIDARLVRKNDQFDMHYDPALRFHHKPFPFGDSGAVVGVYAIARVRNGDYLIRTLSVPDVNAVRARSRAESGPWDTDWDEMALKTAIRRLRKILPSNPRLDRALSAEDRYFDDGPSRVVVSTSPGVSRVEALRRQLLEPEPDAPGIPGPTDDRPDLDSPDPDAQPAREREPGEDDDK